MNQTKKITALAIIFKMDKNLAEFLWEMKPNMSHEEENSRKLQDIVRERWPYLGKMMIPHTHILEQAAKDFINAYEDRKTMLDEGLISYKEFLGHMRYQSEVLYEESKHVEDYY